MQFFFTSIMRLFSPRFKHRSIAYFLVGLICVYLIYLIYNLNNDLEEQTEITSCHHTANTVEELRKLAITLRDLLDSLNLKYFLCYKTLYGAIKNQQPIPWHSNLDLCILNDQLINQDEAFIFRQFLNHKLSLRYSAKHGFYKANFERSNVHAKLFVFERDDYTQNYRRIGLRYRIRYPDQCASIHCFPQHLIESPLPTTQFITQDKYAIPHENEEILKYLFPNDWWLLDDVPEKCKGKM